MLAVQRWHLKFLHAHVRDRHAYGLCLYGRTRVRGRHARPGARGIFTEAITSIPAPLIPPLAFTGFFLALWTYKCIMLVALQNKIIYMPGLPPGARSETIKDYASQCGLTSWEERHIKSTDGTNLALTVSSEQSVAVRGSGSRHSVVLLYFQG